MNQPKYIGALTQGVAQMHPLIIEKLNEQFRREAALKDDWFYEIKVGQIRFFVCDNGERGYTAMLPSEY